MDIAEQFQAVAAILEETIKLLPRNWKFLALISFLSSLLYSSFLLVFNFSTIYLSDILVKQYNWYPTSGFSSSEISSPFDGVRQDIGLLLLVDVFFIVGIFLVSLFSTITTVIVSAASYRSKALSCKDLVLQVVKSWIRPFITSLYIMLLAVGYLFTLLVMASPLLMLSRAYILPIAVVWGVAAYIFYLYFSVILVLALVVSVMEEKNYGIHGLGKAGVLIEGKRLQGYILNIFMLLISWILTLEFNIIIGRGLKANQIVFLIYISVVSCLLKILQLSAYTVLYFHCKKDHGEEMEHQGSVSYKKLASEPPFSDAA